MSDAIHMAQNVPFPSVTVVFLLHGVLAVTGELTLQLPVNFTSSGFNKLAVPASRLQVQVQGTSLSSEYKSNCTSLSVVEV